MDLYELAQQRATSSQICIPLSNPTENEPQPSTPFIPPPIVPNYLVPDPITPDQGVPLQEPDQPIMHPVTKEKLYPVVFEENFGKRKRGADIWKEYLFYKDVQGNLYAVCAHCRDVAYRAESNYGTSNVKRHIAGCDIYKKNHGSPPTNARTKEYDHKLFCETLAEAIMMHGYPFSIVEHKGMRRVFKVLNDDVQTVSRNTIKKVCISKHIEFKKVLKDLFSTLPGKVCLTCDIWTACTSRSYLTLTVHYVDASWTLRSKVLNFFHFAPPHTGLQIYNTLYEKIKEWGLADKVLTMTCDNASNMDNMIGHLKASLLHNLPCDGKFFHVRCAAHILNLVVKEGLDVIDPCVKKVRDTVRYIDASEGRLLKFYACAHQCGLACNTKLWLDVATRWNSTYLMLKKALYYRIGLDLYGSQETAFQHCLSSLEWLKVEKICELLEPFYEITTLFSGSDYPTSNLYFYNVWDIESILLSAKVDVDKDISDMANRMYEKFDKYWREYSMVMSFGVILDPRYKFDFVRFSLKNLYGDDTGIRIANEIYVKFVELFKHYKSKFPPDQRSASTSTYSESYPASRPRRSTLDAFDASYGGTSRDDETEYEFYFRDDKVPRKEKLDVLGYWGRKAATFPVLSSMARDILAIPITSVASESSFSMGGRILNKWRSSLLSKNVEALVTTRNWLFGYEELDEVGVDVDDTNSDDED